MELSELIAYSNRIDEMVRNNNWTEATEKELRKIEMYCRKTYLMLTHLDTLDSEKQNEFSFPAGIYICLSVVLNNPPAGRCPFLWRDNQY